MKKYFYTSLLIFSAYIHPCYADIDSQIEAIQRASDSEKFKLMNAFKKKLIHMKEKERLDAMAKLIHNSQNPTAHKALESLKKQSKQQLKQQLENDTIVIDNITAETIDSIGGDDDDDD